MNQLSYKIKRVFGIIGISLMFCSILSPLTYAQSASSVSQTVPINTSQDYNTIQQYFKSFSWDGFAWKIAKIMVQKITADTVKWINSGFKGSPAFLTNPSGYFADVGDQVTGQFISETGILSGLCSPFNIDLRLSLALGQAGYGKSQRYLCTLNTIIDNVKKTTVNGASIEGFMSGDFRQGGWPAFIELNRPSNNSSGAFLKARSDLAVGISNQQGQKQTQLQQGFGFLSDERCTDITAEDVDSLDVQAQNDGYYGLSDKLKKSGSQTVIMSPGDSSAEQSSVKKIVDKKTGSTKYQSCEIRTPGAVINGQLEKVLGSSIDQLNLADSLNEVISAALGQLVNTVLSEGLSGVNRKSSGSLKSYIDDLSDQTNDPSTYSEDIKIIQDVYAPYISAASTVKDIYQEAVDAFASPYYIYTTAKTCFENLLASSTPTSLMSYGITDGSIKSQINGIKNDLEKLENNKRDYDNKLANASSTVEYLISESDSVTNITDTKTLDRASKNSQTFTKNNSVMSSSDAEATLRTATSTASTFERKATVYYNQCKAWGGN